jgi:P27 family predicted phage terminase small subunit
MTLYAVKGSEGVPAEPDWKSIYSQLEDGEMAHKHWGILVCEMQEVGTLSVANGHAIRRLAEFRVQYERATRDVAERGSVIEAKRTKTPRANPYWTVMRQVDDAIKVLESELGIAPVRRSRASKVNWLRQTERASDRYLKPVPG